MELMHVKKLCKSWGKKYLKNVDGIVFRKHTKPRIVSTWKNIKFTVYLAE